MSAPAPSRPTRAGASHALRLPNPMIFLVWLAIFIPGHFYDWWVERLFAAAVFGVAALVLMMKPAPFETRRVVRQVGIFFFLIQFLFIASFVHAIAFLGLDTGPRDYFEVLRYVFLWVFVVYMLRCYDDRVRRATEAAVAASMYYAIFVALCILKDVPVLHAFFADWLYADTKTYVDYFGTLRLTVPFENPNFLGFYAVQVLTYMMFFSRSRLRLFHIAAAMLVIYFTASRTAWVTTSVALASGLLLYAYLGAIRGRLAVIVRLVFALLLLAGAGTYFSGKIMQNSRLQAVFSAVHKGGIQNESNAAGRLEQTAQAWEFFKISPVFGLGPSKYATFDYVDDQYALWFLRNGAVGALLIIAGLGLIAWRFVRAQRGNLTALVGACTFVVVIALEILTGEFLNNFRLFYLTWFIGTAILRRPSLGVSSDGRDAE